MFLFFSNGTSPVLIGLLAGESSTLMDRINDEILVNKAMSILASIFGGICPKKVFFKFFCNAYTLIFSHYPMLSPYGIEIVLQEVATVLYIQMLQVKFKFYIDNLKIVI